MSDEYQESVEEVQPTTGIDEVTSSENEGIDQSIDQEEVQSDIQDAPQGKLVPLEVVESMREQARELKEHNQQLLQLMLASQRQQQQPQEQQRQEEQFQIADDEFLTGAQLKAILAQQQQQIEQQQSRQSAQQRETFIAEQKKTYIDQYPDYSDVIAAVQEAANTDPAIAEIIMRSKNPVEMAYKYGKVLKGESIGEVKTVKNKVSQENKIQQNLNTAKTLSTVKGTAISGNETFNPEEMFTSRFAER